MLFNDASIEDQKGAITIGFVQWERLSGSQQNIKYW